MTTEMKCKIIEGDLTARNEGILMHQVNCQGAIGAGVSGPIIKKWPEVEQKYGKVCTKYKPDILFGKIQTVWINNGLAIVNSFTQLNYGNSEKTGKKYTNESLLVRNINIVCEKYPDKMVYVPYLIGCGLAGGDWDIVFDGIKDNENLTIVRFVG